MLNSKPLKVCMKCTSKDHKVLERKYSHCDIGCSICNKKTMNKNCIQCKLCNHFVHAACLDLTLNNIKALELNPVTEWHGIAYHVYKQYYLLI